MIAFIIGVFTGSTMAMLIVGMFAGRRIIELENKLRDQDKG